MTHTKHKSQHLLNVADQLSCRIVHISPTQKNLTDLGNYCRNTGLGQGFLCTKGKDHFKFRDSYRLEDTYLAFCINKTSNILMGFVMWTHKFYRTKHKNIVFHHPDLDSLTKLHNTCLIMNLCADKNAPRGTGTLLLLWAMCHSQENNPHHNGTILFVGKKKVKFTNDDYVVGTFDFSTSSGLGLYNKIGFKTVEGHLQSAIKLYDDYVIQYKSEPCEIEFIKQIMSKYI